MRILIAEDDPMMQELISCFMEEYGFGYDIVSNGREAVEKAEEHCSEYDLYIVDIKMPVMNGLEAITRIRRRNHHLPVLITTAMEIPEYLFKEVMVDGYLRKPFDLDQLYSKIMEIAGRDNNGLFGPGICREEREVAYKAFICS
ncbi:MAG: response regulator [Chitinivibrionales bacterium]